MAKFLILFGYTGETIGRFMGAPHDRSQVVADLSAQMGGKLEAYYFMLGQYDGLAIIEVPDAASAAAIAVAVTSSGAFSHFETHELISAADMIDILQKAKGISYAPPGG